MKYERICISVLFVLMSFVTVLYAHEGHHHEEKADTVTVVAGDTIAVNGIPVSDSLSHHDEEEEMHYAESGEGEFVLSVDDALFEHMHNKLIHFPIVLVLAALFLQLYGLKNGNYESAVKTFVISGLIFGIAAIITGLNQAAPFIDTSKEWILDYHKSGGIAVVAGIALWTFFLFVKSLKKYSVIIGVITALLVLAVGLLGGVLAH